MIGSRIKTLRKSKSITQDELALALGLSGKSAVSNYENGYSTPDNEMLSALADYFHVSTDYLLGRTDDPLPVRDVDQDLHDEHDYNAELDAFLRDDEMTSMFYGYENWTEEEKRNLLNILKGQEALRELNKKK